MVERWAENSEVVGSNPTLNTMVAFLTFFILFLIYYYFLVDVIYNFSLVDVNFSSEILVFLSSFIFIGLLLVFFYKRSAFLKKNKKVFFKNFSLKYYLYYRYIRVTFLNNF